MPDCERLEAKDCLKFDHVLSPGLRPVSILRPCFRFDPELSRHQLEQGSERLLGNAERNSWKTQVTELYRKAEPVGSAAALPHNSHVGFIQRVPPDQILLRVGQGKHPLPLGSGEDGATGHAGSS